ncbi:tetratricopeptide repeat protein [Pseudodesulfovibrio cashew]|uniref:Tetratricopeptide repeat protein n=1 Tax=Pseudodesulfovibrio cashew TaxID=2678688 RepID=A0A6I6JEW8_9BACT|nr:tetratricopeptide repeat protein [Pseudodesulfovibrio cashew]QGY40711.1 tetratricopeptide repeat protein [Pseudodesulfovibrio cashew]
MSTRDDIDKAGFTVVRDGAEAIHGVFSTQSMDRVGSPTAQRISIRKVYWSARELSGGDVEVQPINRNCVPSGPKQNVGREEFLAKYSPEPEYYMNRVLPALRRKEEGAGEQAVSSADTMEPGIEGAPDVDEGSVRASFGLGLTYLGRGESNRANDIFERILGLKGAFRAEHKHLFNDFGINLRKNRLFDQALKYYFRAGELVEDDDHLWHNIARCYYEKGDVQQCKNFLRKSLSINPELRESRMFWRFLRNRGMVGATEALDGI